MARPTRRMTQVSRIDVGQPVGQCRALPVHVAGRSLVLAVFGADFDVDPWWEMFFFPRDTLKMLVFDPETGDIHWRLDLGRGVVPGLWFCPVCAFDLDGDGNDEIYYVGSAAPDHPLSLRHRELVRLDGVTGERTGAWPWPVFPGERTLGHQFRDFVLGGYANDTPVLVTAQGTYGDMHLQGHTGDMATRWLVDISAESPGARGSHMCPVVDVTGDGVDELLWGERCIELDDGDQLFCADEEHYRGHSDVVQPVWDAERDTWLIYTCRESDGEVSPRVVCYGSDGVRRWGRVDRGHMDMGWAARLQDDRSHVCSAIRVEGKTCGPDGRHHAQTSEFAFDCQSGDPVDLGYSTYRTVPVDLNGDGWHDLVRGQPSGSGEVMDRHGRVFGNVGGPVAMASKFTTLPGEQLLAYQPGGVLAVWADATAADMPEAEARYTNRFYRAAQRLSATGYNLALLGGL